MNVYVKIREQSSAYTKSDARIADYLLTTSDPIHPMTAKSIAQGAGTSPAAVVRFVKRIGLEGIAELKIRLGADRREWQGEQAPLILSKGQDVGGLIETVQGLSASSAQGVFDLNKRADFAAVIEKLRAAPRIYLFGSGSSGLVAQDLYTKLLRIDRPCLFAIEESVQLCYATDRKSVV